MPLFMLIFGLLEGYLYFWYFLIYLLPRMVSNQVDRYLNKLHKTLSGG